MSRKLNPDLFDSKGTHPEGTSSGEVASSRLRQELVATQKRLSSVESLVETVQSQIKTMAENENKKTQAFSKAIMDLETDFYEQSLVQKRGLEHLGHRLREQKMTDEQIEGLIERFNNNIAQFENKLAVLKKTISEKDMNFITYREILEQIVNDIEKLKS